MLRRDTNEMIDHPKTDSGDHYIPLTPDAQKMIAAAPQRQSELGVDTNGYIFSINGQPLTEHFKWFLFNQITVDQGVQVRKNAQIRRFRHTKEAPPP